MVETCPVCGVKLYKGHEARLYCANCKWYQLKIVEFYSGKYSSVGTAFKKRGHLLYRVTLEEDHEAEMHIDINDLTTETIIDEFGKPDFVWASPPCTKFSIAAVHHHWTKTDNVSVPNEGTLDDIRLVEHTISLMKELKPKIYLIENPKGMMQYLDDIKELQKVLVTYCQYENDKPPDERRMKPTNIFGNRVHEMKWRPPCDYGASCHKRTSRSSSLGTEGMKDADERARVPKELCEKIAIQVEQLIIFEDVLAKNLDNMADVIF